MYFAHSVLLISFASAVLGSIFKDKTFVKITYSADSNQLAHYDVKLNVKDKYGSSHKSKVAVVDQVQTNDANKVALKLKGVDNKTKWKISADVCDKTGIHNVQVKYKNNNVKCKYSQSFSYQSKKYSYGSSKTSFTPHHQVSCTASGGSNYKIIWFTDANDQNKMFAYTPSGSLEAISNYNDQSQTSYLHFKPTWVRTYADSGDECLDIQLLFVVSFLFQ